MLAFAPLLLFGIPGGARAEGAWTWEAFDSLMTAATDPAREASITALARSHLAAATDSADHFMARSLLYRAALAGGAPLERVASQAESLLLACGADLELRAARARVMTYELGAAPRTRPLAPSIAREALAAARGTGSAEAIAGAQVALGWAHLQNGAPDSAVVWLEAGLPTSADSAVALAHLSRAHELRGDEARALSAGIRSLAVYQASDTSAAPRVRALWKKLHGSPRGLAAALEEARAASRRRGLIESARTDLPGPESTLFTAQGDTVRLADHLGQVVVLEFWGSWSGACERSLPHIQALYERYRKKNVAFFGVNVEHTASRGEWMERMRATMKQYGLTFPMIPDVTGLATLSYLVDSFPTTVVVDRAGHIRFKHTLSASADGEAIVRDQIESLLE